jgi:Tol biopolymer transport system component
MASHLDSHIQNRPATACSSIHATRRPAVARVVHAGIAALLLTAATSASAEAHSTGGAGQIVFSRRLPGGGSDVFTVDADGSDEQRVALPLPNEDFGRAVWSHDGRILLISNIPVLDQDGNLIAFRPATINRDGTDFNLLRLPQLPMDMYCNGWSPDDRRILCAVGGDSPGLWSIRSANHGDPVRLTHNEGQDTPVGYSPDGRHIALIRRNDHEHVALFVMRSDGSRLRQLTHYGLLQGHEIATAAWSPDSSTLVTSTAKGRLVTIRANGSGITPIRLRLGRTYFAFAPTYSPNGRRLAFSLRTTASADIYTARLDGSDITQLTNTPGDELFADWSRNIRSH